MTRPAQWRSLEQLADTPAFRQFLEREFPAVTDLSVGPERRHFLKLMAASLALAGLSGCDDPPDGRSQEVPYVLAPLRSEPGAALRFASVALLDGYANGIVVTTRNGRPLKIEGNPEHPWSRGATDVFGQASVLDLYDPARSQSVLNLGRASDWPTFQAVAVPKLAALHAAGGAGVRLLTGPITSPSLQAQVAAMQRFLPGMVWHTHAAIDARPGLEATRRAFGRPLDLLWRFDQTRVIVALDGDFLDPGPRQAGVSRDWAVARQASAKAGNLLALHAAGSLPNLTAAKADYGCVATPAEIVALADGLLADLADPAGPPAAADGSPLGMWRARAAAALHAARGAGLVVAGSTAPVAVAEAVHRLNAALGNTGRTVDYIAPVAAPGAPLEALVEAMSAGAVQALVMVDTNPCYDAPAALGFDAALGHVPLKIHAGLFNDETALRSDWHLPLAHPLESWGDARSPDGTVGLMQPTIAPLYDGKTAAEIISLLTEAKPRDALTIVQAHWQGGTDQEAFAARWQGMLQAGFIADSVSRAETVALRPASAASPTDTSGLTVLIRPDPTIWDGRAANNGWLQELPKPLTKLVWDNAFFVSPALAARETLETGDVVGLSVAGRTIEGPVWVLPGQADGTVGLTLGYGRSVPDLLSAGAGYSAYALRDAGDPWMLTGAALHKTGRSMAFATTQDHNTMEGHDFVRVQVEGEPAVGDTTSWTQPTLYSTPTRQSETAWGMVIDLDACIGCNACVVACQSENNIAVVGREQVALGREMHWLRIDRYYDGPPEAPKTHFQPVPCMHCEEAPCEVGCPVEATLHDSEGLNLMVYNRCVGTRACSGYCPYKVRHFNYLDYSAGAAPSLELGRNPQVSVRARGVMEKCTYCVQRIENARIDADKQNSSIADGVVQTACQAACPTLAITFGNLNDKGSAVAAARADTRNYALLGELNVRPRTTYLAERAPPGGPHEQHRAIPGCRPWAELAHRRARRHRHRLRARGRLALVVCLRLRAGADRRTRRHRVHGAVRGRRRLGQQHPRHLGARHRGLRLVDRRGERRPDGVGAAVAAGA